ncbi:MAG: hypothetical protein QXR02_04400 [Acidilobaceae archaeon]
MSVGCKGHRIMACAGLALSGFISLLSLTNLFTIEILLSYALLSLAMSLTILLLDSAMIVLSYLGIFIAIILALKILNANSILLGALLIPLIVQASYYKGFRSDILTAGLGVVLVILFTIVWDPLFLSATLIVYTTLALKASRRAHTLSMLIGVIIPILWGVIVGLMTTITATILSIVAGAYIERVGCPFKRDSKLIFYGALISTTSLLLAILSGLNTIIYGLWILGFLLLVSGLLVPQKPLSQKSS